MRSLISRFRNEFGTRALIAELVGGPVVALALGLVLLGVAVVLP